MQSHISIVRALAPRPALRHEPRLQLGRVLLLVAASLVTAALTRIDTLVEVGFWSAARAFALVGAAEATVLVLAMVIARSLAGRRAL